MKGSLNEGPHFLRVSFPMINRALEQNGLHELMKGKEQMASFDYFWVKLSDEFVEFAMYDWRGYRAEAISDGKDFLEKTQDDIRRWCKMIEEGTLTQGGFAVLLSGKKDLADLAELKRRGLSRAALDRFMSGLIDIVASTACNFFA
jgi:hypothetical protein